MRFIAAVLQIRFQPSGFIPFIQTQAEPSAGSARLKGVESICNQLYVVGIFSGDIYSKWQSVRIRYQASLYPLFPAVRGAAAWVFEPDSGDFVIQPSIDSHDESIASSCSQASSPFCQKRSNTPASRHS